MKKELFVNVLSILAFIIGLYISTYLIYFLFNPDDNIYILGYFAQIPILNPCNCFAWIIFDGLLVGTDFIYFFYLPIFLSFIFIQLIKGDIVQHFYAPKKNGIFLEGKRKQKKLKSFLNKPNSVVLGSIGPGKYFCDDGDNHTLVHAPTRAGKGKSIVIPTMLNFPDSSIIVVDIKREIFELTSGRRSLTSDVIYFNPSDPNSHRYNPLDNLYYSNNLVIDAYNLSEILLQKALNRNDAYWFNMSVAWLTFLILYVFLFEQEKNLRQVATLYVDPNRTINQFLNQIVNGSNLNIPDHLIAEAKKISSLSDGNRTSIIGSVDAALHLFRAPIVGEVTSESHFNMLDLIEAEKPLTIYLCIDVNDLDTFSQLFNLMVTNAVSSLTGKLKNPNKKRNVLLLADEFPTLDRIPIFVKALNLSAGYGLKALLIAQSENQVRELYKSSLNENSNVKVYFPGSDVSHSKHISPLLGNVTKSKTSHNSRTEANGFLNSKTSLITESKSSPAMTPEEIQNLADPSYICTNKKRIIYSLCYSLLKSISYFIKQPSKLNNALNLLIEKFGYYLRKYSPYIIVTRTKGSFLVNDISFYKDPYFAQLLLPSIDPSSYTPNVINKCKLIVNKPYSCNENLTAPDDIDSECKIVIDVDTEVKNEEEFIENNPDIILSNRSLTEVENSEKKRVRSLKKDVDSNFTHFDGDHHEIGMSGLDNEKKEKNKDNHDLKR